METKAFLEHILPTNGTYCLLTIKDKVVRQHFYQDIDALADAATTFSGDGWNAYQAMGTFHDETSRKHDNVAFVKALYFDLDVGAEKAEAGKGYPNQKAALLDLSKFVAEQQLPRPMIVSSGNGIHVYWVLTEELTRDQWQPLANDLKALALNSGMCIDPAVTADSARVLRPAGTTNQKGGKTVTVLLSAAPVDKETLQNIFSNARLTGKLKSQPQSTPTRTPGKVTLLDKLSVKNQYAPSNAAAIAEKCKQINWAVNNQDKVDEPLWYSAVIGIAAHCENPEQVAVEWSKNHPEFDEAKTLDKLEQWKARTTGPTTCARISDLRAKGCDKCIFKGRITSPAQLGVQYAEVQPDEAAPIPENGADVLDLPFPYKRTAVGICRVAEDTDIVVFPYDIFPVSYGKDESLGYEVVRFMWKRPHVGWTSLTFRQALLTSGMAREYQTLMADNGILFKTEKQGEESQFMLRNYIEKLKETQGTTNLYDTMGWKDDFREFVMGNSLLRLTPEGEVEEVPVSMASAVRAAENAYGTKGSAEITTAILKKLHGLGFHSHIYTIAVSLSAAMYEFSGLRGSTLSLFGPSGSGKTLAQYMAQSMWGNPVKTHLGSKFTLNALYSRMAMIKNMVFTVDEATMFTPELVTDFLYGVSQGKDKIRLTKNAEEREAKEFALPAILSTNKSLMSQVYLTNVDVEAQLARLVELHFLPHKAFVDGSDAGRKLYELFCNNYGHLGRVVVAHLMKLGEAKVKTMIIDAVAKVPEIYGASFIGRERFSEQQFVLAHLAFDILKQSGHITFDWTDTFQFVIAQMQNARQTIDENRVDAFDIIGEYLNEVTRRTVSVYYTPGAPPQSANAAEGNDGLYARIELYRPSTKSAPENGTIYIYKPHFRQWLAQKGYDWDAFYNEVRAEAADASPKSGKYSLGKDTGHRLPNVYVFGVDMKHERLRNMLVNTSVPPALSVVPQAAST